MSRIDAKMSGLPVDIYVDEIDSWEKIGTHRRIKIQGSKKDRDDWKKRYSMSIERKPRVLVKDAQIDLTDEELKQVKKFVSKNRHLLTSMAKGKFTMTDFAEKLGWIKRKEKMKKDCDQEKES